jgi:DNA primase
MRVRADDIEELKSRLDIVEVVSGYLALKPAGAGSFKGLCPFHGEKTPSFNVRANPAFYHCFGCGVGGDVIKFVQEIERISFADAVTRLAEKIGFQLTPEEGAPEQSQRNRLLAANAAAAEFYATQLAGQEAAFARDFLIARGFDAEAAKQFGVGYAPKGWRNLLDALTAKGFSIDELETAGLVSKNERGGYDRFRGRLVWPIRDSNSQVLGFGARKLYEDDGGPKYLNTPETPIYRKAQVLYGLDLARKDIAKNREVVVVEGYTDVMACHLAGVQTAVATCGTAFGLEHIKLINRLLGDANENPAAVVFTFDPDAAGEKAALKVYGDTEKFSALTYVAAGPAGLDPADLRLKHGDTAVREMLTNRKPLFEFVIRHRLSKFDLSDVGSRVAAARSAAPVLAQISDSALRGGYLRQLADWVTLEVQEVEQLVAAVGSALKTETVAAVRLGEAPAPSRPVENRHDRQMLEVLLQHPSAFDNAALQRIAAAGLADSGHQQVVQAALRLAAKRDESNWANLLLIELPDELGGLIRELAMAQLPVNSAKDLDKYASGVVRGALLQALSREKTELLAALRRVDPDAKEQLNQIQQQLVELDAERRALM